MKNKLFLLVCICVVALAGCYKDTEEELYPDWSNTNTTGCDTTDVSFSTTVKPILDQYCATAGCHDATNSAGYNLTTYNGAVQAKSRLIGVIKWETGYSAMPKGGTKLSDCQIAQVSAWVNEGTKNN
jgi:hypothetical protein